MSRIYYHTMELWSSLKCKAFMSSVGTGNWETSCIAPTDGQIGWSLSVYFKNYILSSEDWTLSRYRSQGKPNHLQVPKDWSSGTCQLILDADFLASSLGTRVTTDELELRAGGLLNRCVVNGPLSGGKVWFPGQVTGYVAIKFKDITPTPPATSALLERSRHFQQRNGL